MEITKFITDLAIKIRAGQTVEENKLDLKASWYDLQKKEEQEGFANTRCGKVFLTFTYSPFMYSKKGLKNTPSEKWEKLNRFLYYKPLPDSRGLRFVDTPVIQVILNNNNRKSNLIFAIVDSGAEHCLFSFSIGTFLGIDVFAEEEIRLGSLGAVEPMKAYLHNIEMEQKIYLSPYH